MDGVKLRALPWLVSHTKGMVKKVKVKVKVGAHLWLESDHLVPRLNFRFF